MNVGSLFKSALLQAGRALGVVAEKDAAAATGHAMAKDVLSLSTRRAEAAAVKPEAAAVAQATRTIRQTLDEQLPLAYFAEGRDGSLAMANDVRLDTIVGAIRGVRHAEHDPVLSKVRQLAEEGHGEHALNKNKSYYQVTRTQFNALQRMRMVIGG